MTEKITAVTSVGHTPRKVLIKSNSISGKEIDIVDGFGFLESIFNTFEFELELYPDL